MISKATQRALILLCFTGFFLLSALISDYRIHASFWFGDVHTVTIKNIPKGHSEGGQRRTIHKYYRYLTYENRFQVMSISDALKDGDTIECVWGYHDYCLQVHSATANYSYLDYVKSRIFLFVCLGFFLLSVILFPFRFSLLDDE